MHQPIVKRCAGLGCALILLAALVAPRPAQAGDDAIPTGPQMASSDDPLGGHHGAMNAASGMDPAIASGWGHGAAIPAGVFGARMVGAGEASLLYTPMFMGMNQNYIGSSTVSPTTIVTTIPYYLPYATGMKPPTLRIAPTSMSVESHMFHAMYGVTDIFNIMVMGAWVDKSMTMTTYSGMKGTTPLGSTTVTTNGWSDTSVVGLIRVYQDGINHIHLNLGLSLPTGSIKEQATMLSPMGTYMTMRAMYGMQIGTGTFDGLYGVTYTGKLNAWSWGLAYRGRSAFGDNSQGYHWGPSNELSLWGAYQVAEGLNFTGRAVGSQWNHIEGHDPLISGPMQGTDPYYYGGERIKLLGGLEYITRPWGLTPVRLAVEAGAPVYQRLNGPQLGESWQVNAALGIHF